jgi:hypothetical protein
MRFADIALASAFALAALFMAACGALIIWEGLHADSTALGVMTMLFAIIPATLAACVAKESAK